MSKHHTAQIESPIFFKKFMWLNYSYLDVQNLLYRNIFYIFCSKFNQFKKIGIIFIDLWQKPKQKEINKIRKLTIVCKWR